MTGFAGQTKNMTESELIAWALNHRPAGARVVVTLLRAGRRIEVQLRLQ